MLAAGFGELAAQLGVRGLADTRDPVASVHAVLAKFQAPWLLIFDNAADLASVEAFLPPAGPGHVLITSQNPNWPGHAMDVPKLDQDVAAGFLASRTGDPDRQAAQELADALGGLPLALEQAAAYTQATGHTLAGYLVLFRQRRAELLARGEPRRIQQDGGEHLGACVRPPTAYCTGCGRPAATADVLRSRGDPAAPAAATRPGAGRAARRGGCPGAGAAAGGPIGRR